jgi:four helix bundle protein
VGKVERFEDLIAWQKARELTKLVYFVSGAGSFAKDWGLKDQIRRASVSVMSNVAEGFDRAGRAEFHQFLVIAKGSCAEVRAQLYVALDAEYVSKEQFDKIYAVAEETGRIVNGLRAAVERQRDTMRG